MKLVSKTGKHVKKPSNPSGSGSRDNRQPKNSGRANIDEIYRETVRQPKSKPAQNKQAASYKEPTYSRPAQPKQERTAPREPEYERERYYEPPREPEYRRDYERERYYEPPREPEYRRDYERERYYEPPREREYRRDYERDRYYEPEREYRRSEPRYDRKRETAVQSAESFESMLINEFMYDDWMPVGTKSKIKKQAMQVRQAEGYGAADEWDNSRRGSGYGKKKSRGARVVITLVCVLVILVDMYFRFLYTDVPFIRNLRDAYIETAMSTMSHQWMAEWFFPQDIIDEVTGRVEKAQQDQRGIESDWGDEKEPEKTKAPVIVDENAIKTEEDFYATFSEIDKNTFKEYLLEHPEAAENGWGNIYINEAGLEDNGTSIWTKTDEQVLAIDAKNKILLIRVQGSGYQGVLAIAKDPSKLSLCPAENAGTVGEQLDSIMRRSDAVLGMTGSGFIDEGGNGNGGMIVGFARCSGEDTGTQVGYPYKRTELREDNRLYVVDSGNEVDSATTDAVEFAPALVINGEALIDGLSGYTSINPRACIGQTQNGDLLMLVIEGRLPSRSFGTGLPECTEILVRHGAYQAMNLDGGTSAIMWFDGEYVTKCSNTNITCRTLPNAWIYARAGSAEEATDITE